MRNVMEDLEAAFKHSGITDRSLYLEFKAIVQPFLDKANADPHGDHTSLDAEMRAALLPFLKKHNPHMQ
jgi:hypothetical protein